MGNEHAPRLSLDPLGSLFSASWKLYRERFDALTEITMLPVLTLILAVVLIGLGSVFAAVGILVLLAGIIALAFVYLPIIASIHHNLGVDAAYKHTFPSFWPFVWVTILNSLAVFGGFFMLIIPGLWLSIALSMMRYTFVIENRRGIDALRQSKDYLKGYWWAMLGRVILIAIIFVALLLIVEIPFGIAFGTIGAHIAAFIMVLFLIPFASVYLYKIFENLRALKPELESTERKTGTGFIVTSAIVGLAAPIFIAAIIVLLGVFGIWHASMNGSYYMPPPRYHIYTYPQ